MKEEKNKCRPDGSKVCEPCETEFQQSIQELVDKVDDYSKKDHREREKEIREVFDNENKD